MSGASSSFTNAVCAFCETDHAAMTLRAWAKHASSDLLDRGFHILLVGSDDAGFLRNEIINCIENHHAFVFTYFGHGTENSLCLKGGGKSKVFSSSDDSLMGIIAYFASCASFRGFSNNQLKNGIKTLIGFSDAFFVPKDPWSKAGSTFYIPFVYPYIKFVEGKSMPEEILFKTKELFETHADELKTEDFAAALGLQDCAFLIDLSMK